MPKQLRGTRVQCWRNDTQLHLNDVRCSRLGVLYCRVERSVVESQRYLSDMHHSIIKVNWRVKSGCISVGAFNKASFSFSNASRHSRVSGNFHFAWIFARAFGGNLDRLVPYREPFRPSYSGAAISAKDSMKLR
jgi:hypothetical protein